MAKNYGIKDISSWKFEDLNLPEEWQLHLGALATGSRVLIKGDPKNGKTEYLIKFIKMLAIAGYKVNFNSTEQGKSKSLQAAFLRNQIHEIGGGKLMLCSPDQRTFEVWFKKLQRPNQGQVIVLDSMDYMKISFDQVKQLLERFPGKTIILVSWMVNPIIKQVEHMMDAIVHVKEFRAKPISRLGGNTDFIIWNKKGTLKQLELL